MFRRTFIGAAASVASLPLASLAQDAWPTKPVKIICPFPAGGTSDVMARMVAEPLTKELGQQVIVENIGGAGGTIGTLRATEDGARRLHASSRPAWARTRWRTGSTRSSATTR